MEIGNEQDWKVEILEVKRVTDSNNIEKQSHKK